MGRVKVKKKMLQMLFNGKIYIELEKFKKTMFSLEPEEIFANAYERYEDVYL